MPEDHGPTDEELERRLKHLLGSEGEAAEEADPIEAKLTEIEERTKKIRADSRMPEPPEWDFKRPDISKTKYVGGDYYRDLGFGFAVLYSLVGPLGVGFGIGYFIDKRNPGSTAGELWGTIIGCVCGLVAAFVTISKHERKT